MDTTEHIIEKVKKLLKLSTSSNIHESATAAALANKLIDQHRLSVADLTETIEEVIVKDNGFIYETGRVIPWKKNLVCGLASHYGCKIVNENDFSSGRKQSKYRLIGLKSDIDVCKYMCAWLMGECIRLSDKEAKGKGHVFVFSYCEGFVAGVMEQLRLSREAVKLTATSTAIVKIDSRLKEANVAANKMYGGLVQDKTASKVQRDYNAYDSGKEKGRTIHLGSSLKSSN